MNKVTNFVYQPAAEGDRIIYTYSELNANGDIISSNNRKNIIVTDDTVIDSINTIKRYFEER